MSLKYPLLLLLIPFAALLLYLAQKTPLNQKSLLYPFRNRSLTMSGASLELRKWLPFALRLLGLALVIFCLARPQNSSTHTRRMAEGIDIVVALDVSESMLIEDEEGKNRLKVAKDTIKRFINGRKDDRIGFVMFSGEAVTLCPPTLDYDAVLAAVDQSDIRLLKDGTAIGEGLATSVNRLKDSSAKSKIVILVTDGDNNMGAIAPLTAGDIAVGYGIKVYAIALGKEGLVNLPVETDFFGVRRRTYQQVNSSINPALLMKIAEDTGGRFFRAEDTGSMRNVFSEINKLETTKVETKDRVLWEEKFQAFLAAAILILLLEMFLRITFFRILPE